MAKKKYYAVKKGYKTGIFETWDECQKQTNGYSGAIFKSFKNKEDALEFLNKEKDSHKPNKSIRPVKAVIDDQVSCECEDMPLTIRRSKYTLNDLEMDLKDNEAVAYVDGSNKQDIIYSFGMIFFSKEGVTESFKAFNDEMKDMRNVSGELRGAVQAINKALELKKKKLYLMYDYEGIEKWATGKWKTKKEGTKLYKSFIDSISDKIEIVFVKVAAHTGDTFNEVADDLAKEAIGLK